jgi:tRNA(Arg) A34 adenosine deaminase TadA
MSSHRSFLDQAVALARQNAVKGARPFGAVVVRDGIVLGKGVNDVAITNDPTAHADIQAIREATRTLGSPRLDGAVMYVSGHPCPMCLAAAHVSGIDEVIYAYSLEDAEPYGLSTAAIYADMAKPVGSQSVKITQAEASNGARELYDLWRSNAV